MRHCLTVVLGLGLLAGVAQAAPKASPDAPAIAPDLKAAAPAPDLKAGEKPAEAPAPAASVDGGAPPAPAAALAPKQLDEVFDAALTKHFKGDRVEAAAGFYTYLRGSSKTADRYEWAEHFLSLDLDGLGFAQAALEYEVFVAEERARPEVLPEALRHIEALIARNPYPADLVEDELLHGTDFGPLPEGPRSFVSYYQGLVDYRHGETKWGDARFKDVDPASPYAARVRYLKAVYKLVHERDSKGALADFTALAADKEVPRELRNQARMAVARLDYEQKSYRASYEMWSSVELPELDPGRAPIYLERAWNLYRLKEYGDAMGLLAALEAPSFRDVFLPDKYLLRSLIYKDLCHYLPSKRSARAFSRRYASPLRDIRARTPLEESPKLLAAALQTDDVLGKASALRTSVTKEKDLIDRYASPWSDSGLANELQRIYGLLQPLSERHYEVALHDGVKRAADQLLTEEEQLRLEDYEVGLAMYQRYKKGHIVTDAPKSEAVEPDEVVYPFDGEYWNDELHDYHLFITSRCLETEGTK